MLNPAYLLLAILIGYLFGAIPFGFLFVKLTKNVDLRTVGSGRTGGTNSFRAAGITVGTLTALSDVLKGFVAIWLARLIIGNLLGIEEAWLPWAEVACGVMAVVGHNWSIFLGWGGGAGTGPNVGWAAAIWWPMAPIGLLVVGGLLLGVGIASVASLAMGLLIPLIFGIRYLLGVDASAAYMVGGFIAFLVVAWSLRPNIKRLVEGSERIVGPAARRKTRKAKSQETANG